MRERGFEPLKALSQHVLSVFHLTTLAPPHKKLNVYSYKKLYKHNVLGISEDDHSDLETPKPIPNLEAKLITSRVLVSERM